MATAVLLEDDYVSVRWWEDAAVALVARTSTPLPADERSLDRHFSRLLAALSGLPRAKTALVVDGRDARGRNDDVFERVQRRYRSAVFAGFRERALVLGTTAGRMQAARHAREVNAAPLPVYADLMTALGAVRDLSPA